MHVIFTNVINIMATQTNILIQIYIDSYSTPVVVFVVLREFVLTSFFFFSFMIFVFCVFRTIIKGVFAFVVAVVVVKKTKNKIANIHAIKSFLFSAIVCIGFSLFLLYCYSHNCCCCCC